MGAMDLSIEDILPGDWVAFEKRFTMKDFRTFSALSGDENPLHWDADYAKMTEFGDVIVPLQLATAPFSAIVGMMLPGLRALYLGSSVRARAPIPYRQKLTYSAKVVSCSAATSSLSLQVIVFSGKTIHLECEVQAKIRPEVGYTATVESASKPVWRGSRDQRTYAITGAAGEIGSAIARALAGTNTRLLLNGRENDDRLSTLGQECVRRGADVELVAGALDLKAGRRHLASVLAREPEISGVVHAACPPIHASLSNLMGVNYTALKSLADAALSSMLRRQSGFVMLIGSSSVLRVPLGWEDYTAAKTAAQSYIDSVEKNFSEFGVRGLVVAPGYVETAFSDSERPPDAPALVAEEVADTVATTIADAAADTVADTAPFIWIEKGARSTGRVGFSAVGTEESASVPPGTPRQSFVSVPTAGVVDRDMSDSDALGDHIRRVLKLKADYPLEDAGLDVTPGWDSLAHLEIIMSVERAWGVQFSATEAAESVRYSILRNVLRARLSR
jgi:short-subunit dehydrogenase/acyl dehydratase/acyl carrier protein